MVIWIPKNFTPVFFVVAASAVQQFQTTERETTEAVAECLKYTLDRRGGGCRKKDQDWTKNLSNWYSKRHGDAHTSLFLQYNNYYNILTYFLSFWIYEPLENMSKWGENIRLHMHCRNKNIEEMHVIAVIISTLFFFSLFSLNFTKGRSEIRDIL